MAKHLHHFHQSSTSMLEKMNKKKLSKIPFSSILDMLEMEITLA